MKKLILLLLIVIAYQLKTYAQFPQNQTLGNPTTQVYSKGGLGADSGFVFRYNFPDTVTVNLGFLKGIPGIMIRVNDQIYVRNQSATAWLLKGNAGNVVPIGTSLQIGVANTPNIKGIILGTNMSGDTTGTDIILNASGDTTIANVLDYGAVANDGTDDSHAFKLAIATGKKVYVPSIGRYRIDSTLLLADKQVIFGGGVNSWLYTTKDTINVIHLIDSAFVDKLTIQGTGIGTEPAGTFTQQNGVYFEGNGNTISNCYFYDIKGTAIYSWIVGTIKGNRVLYNYAVRCTYGVFFLLNSEYSYVIGNNFNNCIVAIFERNSGNNQITNNVIDYNAYAFRVLSNPSGNGGHGRFVNNTVNHNTYGLDHQSENNSYIYGDNDFYANTYIRIGTGADTVKNVSFINNDFSGAVISVDAKVKNLLMTGGSFGTGMSFTGSGLASLRRCNIMNSDYQNIICGFQADSLILSYAQLTTDTTGNYVLLRNETTGAVKKIPAGALPSSGGGMTNPMTTAEDIIVGGSGGTPTRLPKGTDGQVLTVVSGALAYSTPAGGGDVVKVGTPVNNQVGVWTGDGTIEGDPNYTWNGTTLAVTGAASASTSVTSPLLIGTSSTTSGITYKASTGAASGANPAHTFTAGNNGATTLMTMNHSGTIGIGTAPFAGFRMTLYGLNNANGLGGFLYRNSGGSNMFYIEDGGNVTQGNTATTSTFTVNSATVFNGAIRTAFVAKTANYTATAADYTITGDATSAAFTITLPTAASVAGRNYIIKKIDASGNAVNVGTTSSQTIDGAAAPYVLATQWKFVHLQSDGANWIIVGAN